MILEERVATSPEAMKKTFENMPSSRIALETGTHSPCGPGLSTGGHHILSLAEAMVRGFSPAFVDVQACAHSTPTEGNESRVVAWIEAAAIIARQDPIAKGYLTKIRLAPFVCPHFDRPGASIWWEQDR